MNNDNHLIGSFKSLIISLHEKCTNTEFFSGQYFPVFSPNTGKYGPEKTPYLDTFHAVYVIGLQRLIVSVAYRKRKKSPCLRK